MTIEEWLQIAGSLALLGCVLCWFWAKARRTERACDAALSAAIVIGITILVLRQLGLANVMTAQVSRNSVGAAYLGAFLYMLAEFWSERRGWRT